MSGRTDLHTAQLEALCRLALRAGEEIMAVYGTAAGVRAKADASPLTEADLRADAVIRDGLAKLRPDIAVVSEEHLPSRTPSGGESYFLVDPLDGTKEFLARNGEFTVNIALIEGGVPVAGVVHAPALGLLYHAAVGLGSHRRDAGSDHALRVSAYDPQVRPLQIIGSRTHGGERLARWIDALPVERAFAPAGSSLKFCRIAEGAADLYPRLGPTCLWDTAAAQCVLEQAQGHVRDLAGRRLAYGPREGWLNPEFVAFGDVGCAALCESLEGC
jgi:3'(2'), 5'-bisphosphate nucleotidase